MAEEDDAQKTEDATDKKLSDAKNRGEVAQSQEIKSWAVLFAGGIAIVLLVPWMGRTVSKFSLKFIEQGSQMSLSVENFKLIFADVSLDLFLVLAPLFGLLIVMAVASNIVQVGLVISGQKIIPDLKKISLLKGLKKMFSMRSVIEFLKGISKLVLVGAISLTASLPLIDDLELLPRVDISESLDRLYMIAVTLTLATVAVMTFIAIADYLYQKHTFLKQMKMTKQEIKDEHKNADGDPLVKAKIRQIRMQRAQQRMMAAVPEADVIVTNPTHFSIALKYDMETMPAPILVAKGIDSLAFRIREVAKENEILIIENPPLARALYASVEIDEEIPTEHFAAVAEIIGFVMRKRGKL